MMAYFSVAAQIFTDIVQVVQIIVIWIIAKQIGAKFDIHIWRNGKDKEGS